MLQYKRSYLIFHDRLDRNIMHISSISREFKRKLLAKIPLYNTLLDFLKLLTINTIGEQAPQPDVKVFHHGGFAITFL